MKKTILILGILVSSAMIFNACSGNSPKKTEQITEKAEYTCPMHPEVLQDKPGTCPKCGMELEKKTVAKSDSMQKIN